MQFPFLLRKEGINRKCREGFCRAVNRFHNDKRQIGISWELSPFFCKWVSLSHPQTDQAYQDWSSPCLLSSSSNLLTTVYNLLHPCSTRRHLHIFYPVLYLFFLIMYFIYTIITELYWYCTITRSVGMSSIFKPFMASEILHYSFTP